MAELVHITFEGNNLDEFSALIDPDSDLSTSADSAMVGSYGMEVLIDDQTSTYGRYSGMTLSNKLGYRIYIDPNNLTMATTNEFNFMDSWADTSVIAQLGLNYTTAAGYRLRASIGKDPGPYTLTYGAYINITDAPHCVEILVTRATTDSASDGSLEIWVDGVSQYTIADQDNYDIFVSSFQVSQGARAGMDSGTTGTFYLDDIIVRDDGQYIGPWEQQTLTVADGSHTQTADAPHLSQDQFITVADGQHTQTGDSPHLSQNQFLVLADGSHTQTSDVPHLSQNQFLVIADGEHTQTGDSPHLSQNQFLVVADGEHIHTGDTITLSGITYLLVVQDGEHEHLADGIIIDTDEILLVRPRSWWPFWSQ